MARSQQHEKTSPGSTRTLRSDNEQRVLQALRRLGALSQAETARQTGLSPATVNSIVRTLADRGVVTVNPGKNGRESLVRARASDSIIMAIEVAPKAIHVALFLSADERRIDTELRTTDRLTRDESFDRIRLARSVVLDRAGLRPESIDATYVALLAPFDPQTGYLIPSATAPRWEGDVMADWHGRDLRELLAAELGTPVSLEGDSRLAAMAEWMWGEARGASDLLYVKCGTGVGGGVVLGGRLHRGQTGLAGEIGHVVVDPLGPPCICGARGCLFTFVAGGALLRQLERAGHRHESLVAMTAAARDGDLISRRLIAEAGQLIGRAAADASKIIAPQAIVFGGQLASAGALLLEPISTSIRDSGLWGESVHAEVVAGMLRSDMSALGALALHQQENGLGGPGTLPHWLRNPIAVRDTSTIRHEHGPAEYR